MTKCIFVLYEMCYWDFRIDTMIFSYYNKGVKFNSTVNIYRIWNFSRDRRLLVMDSILGSMVATITIAFIYFMFRRNSQSIFKKNKQQLLIGLIPIAIFCI